jgi:hypothetical protein
VTPIIDSVEVLASLKDFQRRTARWVFQRMFDEEDPALRFLVADEVGLGKTHVAKGVIAQVIEHLDRLGDDRHDIVYICSNAAIARQNLRKLVPKGIEALDGVERLTMLPLAQLNERSEGSAGVNLLAITPGTSLKFGRNTGRFEERALAYTFLRELWGPDAFRSAASRRIFWFGVGAYDGDRRLKDAQKRYASRIDTQVASFGGAISAIDMARRAQRRRSLRSTFDELVDGIARRHGIPQELVHLRGEFIGDVRRAMATVGITMLQPDLVVLDEFQRFKDLLNPEPDDWAAELANRLFTHIDADTQRPTRTLLLSATPYQMYTTADKPEADHYSDFVRTCRFLLCDDQRVDRIEAQFAALRQHLTGRSLDDAERVCAGIEAELRAVMARTERLAATPDRDGMLKEVPSEVTVETSDLRAYLRLGDLAEAVEHHEPSEYWKSSPYLFNFMEQYKLKQALELAVDNGLLAESDDLRPGPGLLDWDSIERYEELDPQNGRLRWLLDDLHSHNAFDLLWIPPSMRYYDANTVYERSPAVTFTKRLIFSGWAVVPKVVSSVVSYEAERQMFGQRSHKYTADYRARGGRRLAFRLDDRRPAAMTAFLFVWPSPTLAELGDPRPTSSGPAPTVEEVLDGVRNRLREPLASITKAAPSAGQVDERWYWAAALLLDREHNSAVIDDWWGMRGSESNWSGDEVADGFRSHSNEAWKLVIDEADPLGRVPDDLVDVLAEVAVGGPAVCALRAIAATTGLGLLDPDSLNAAARVAWGFRALFNAPEVTALVVDHDNDAALGEVEGRSRYWRDAVRHAIGGNLQAVLDEHAHVLRDWLGFIDLAADEQRAAAAANIAERMVDALDVRTASFRVDIPRRRSRRATLGERRMRSRFAVPFGNQRLEDGGEARVESISAAFNSPFWPFVLTSTSVGQEGLDFHLWCHSVVHWNLPSNPVDLEQREGRVHRFKGHAVRKNIAATIGGRPSPKGDRTDIWDELFSEAVARRDPAESEMVPYWVFNGDAARIERHAPVLPFSRDAAALPRLRRSLAAYRLAFGQPRQEELLEFLSADRSDAELAALARRLRIDLSPPA